MVLALCAAALQAPQASVADAVQRLKSARIVLKLSDAPLDALVEQVSEALDEKVAIDPEVRRFAPEEELRFTVVASEMSVHQALRLTLRPRGLSMTVRDGRVVVVPLWMTQQLESRRYNVTVEYGLLSSIGRMKRRPRPAPATPGATQARPAAEAGEDPAAQAIRHETGGNFWKHNPRATVRFWGIRQTYMDVMATPEVHEEIRPFLDKIAPFAVP